MYNYIRDPATNKQYSIKSKEGKKLIENYVNKLNLSGGGDKNDTHKLSMPDRFKAKMPKKLSDVVGESNSKRIHDLGSHISSKLSSTGESIKHSYDNLAHKNKSDHIVIATNEYNKAFEAEYPKLLQQYLENVNKYDDTAYQNAVIRDGCKTAWLLLTNLKNMNLPDKYGDIDKYKCNRERKDRISEIKGNLQNVEEEDKIIGEFTDNAKNLINETSDKSEASSDLVDSSDTDES